MKNIHFPSNCNDISRKISISNEFTSKYDLNELKITSVHIVLRKIIEEEPNGEVWTDKEYKKESRVYHVLCLDFIETKGCR